MINSKEDRKKFNKRKREKDVVKINTKIELKDGEAASGDYHDKFDVVQDSTECDPAVGDYLDGDRACTCCAARMLCLLNAVKLGNIIRDTLAPELKRMLDTANPNDISSLIANPERVMAIPAQDTKKKKKRRTARLK